MMHLRQCLLCPGLALLIWAALNPAQAATCRVGFPAAELPSPAAPGDAAPCADALLAIPFARLSVPPGAEIHVTAIRHARDAEGQDNAFVSFQLATAERRRLCPASAAAADMQAAFIRDARDGWTDLDSRGSLDPAECGQWTLWSDQDIDDLLHPPHFSAVPLARRAGVRDVVRGDAQRKALLDAVRQANADLNDRTPIVFVVDLLRSDGQTAYFRGQVRRKSDGQPLDAAIWGPCEQDPDTAVLEALLERRGGHWQAIKANRCADDVFLSDAERARYRLFVMEK